MSLIQRRVVAFIAAAMLVSAVAMADSSARNPDIKCGPASDGGELVWMNTETHQIWINKEDDLASAFPLTTTTWSADPSSKFSIRATATLQLQVLATLQFTMIPSGDSGAQGSLAFTLGTADGSMAEPTISCTAI